MKMIYKLCAMFLLGMTALTTHAKDEIFNYAIVDVMSSEDAKNILGTDVQFYFGDEEHPAIVKEISEFSTMRKSNGATKSDKASCERAFLSTMKVLKEKAQSVGANAVVNIRSNYSNNPTSSKETYKCASGMLMSAVYLVGDVVVIEK